MTTYTTRLVRVAEDHGQRVPWFSSMQIWVKVSISLGILAALTVLVALISYLAGARAQDNIRGTNALHLPAALAAARAQADVQRMAGDLQAYLALGQPAYRESYARSASAVAGDLAALAGLAKDFDAVDRQHMSDLAAAEDRWTNLADRLLALQANGLTAYQNEAVPLAQQMLGTLDQIIANQQASAQNELGQGSVELANPRWVTLAASLVAVFFSLAAFFLLRQSIGGRIRRLTRVADQVRAGDLTAQAVVDSRDEIGSLADSLNRMTRQLRRTLFQTRREKKRADDLLNVVIPLGLELTAEKNFDRLLENIVIQAQAFCHATCGILYLRNADGQLQPIVFRDDAAGLAWGGTTGEPIAYDPIPLDDPMYSLTVRTAWFGNTVNVPDAVPAGGVNFVSPQFVEDPYANNTSFLAIPLRPSQGQVMGVLQLTGALDPDTRQIVPFDSHLQQMMESFSYLAAAALEAYLREQGLKEQIAQLRIEIDEVKRQQQVKEIVESDYFPSLQAKARSARERSARNEQAKAQDVGDKARQDQEPGAS